MKILKTVEDMRKEQVKGSLGFVATMGALHEGHGALILESKKENDQTCVSVFVNPTQFNNSKDFESYPDRTKEDLEFCEKHGVDYVFMPVVKNIYTDDETISLKEGEVTSQFEGEHRPGHFNGVLLVVMKLLNIINPERAYFGEKDYQQYLLIKKMSEQFFMKSRIVGVPIERDEECLALSSRNYNLSEEGIKKARLIAKAFLATSSKEGFVAEAGEGLELEYYGEKWGRALIAHYVEGVRLIDNKSIGGSL